MESDTRAICPRCGKANYGAVRESSNYVKVTKADSIEETLVQESITCTLRCKKPGCGTIWTVKKPAK